MTDKTTAEILMYFWLVGYNRNRSRNLAYQWYKNVSDFAVRKVFIESLFIELLPIYIKPPANKSTLIVVGKKKSWRSYTGGAAGTRGV